MREKLYSEKDIAIWKPRLTRDTIKFAAKDPEASPTNPEMKSINEGHSTLYLDEGLQI